MSQNQARGSEACILATPPPPNKKNDKLTISVPDIFSRPRLLALEELLSLSRLILSTGNTDDILSL